MPRAEPVTTVRDLLAARTDANRRFFDDVAADLASLCHAMAERFARGGRLIAVGRTPAARSDVRHVAVEFVHPVIVGKRALPATAPSAAEPGAVLTPAPPRVRPWTRAIPATRRAPRRCER